MTAGRIPNIEGGIQPTLLTTTGDIMYASSASNPARLGIGSSAQVLTVAGGIPSWATPSVSAFSGCVLTNSNSTQSVATNTATAVTFNTEAIDTDNYHSTSSNTERITIPSTKVGKYLVTAAISMAANATGARAIKIGKNGTAIYETTFPATATGTSFGQISFVMDLASADYLTAIMFQTSGVSLNVAGTDTTGTGPTSFQATYLGA